MATPNHLSFSSPCVVGDDSDHTPSSSSPFVSQGQSPRTESLAKQESKKKKKTSNKKKKLDSSLFKRIWNEEDELLVLKGLVDYRIKSRHEPKIDWDGFYRFLGGCIVAKFSKEQVLSKIRKLKRRFLVHLERINERKDPNFTTSSDSEAFGFSMMLWGQLEAEVSDSDVDKEMLKEHEKQPLNENGAGKITENKSGEEMMEDQEEVANAEHFYANGAAKIMETGVTSGEAQQSRSGEEMCEEHEEVADAELHDEVDVDKITDNGTSQKAQQRENGEMLKDHEEVTNAEPLNDNGAVKITEKGTTSGKESHEDEDELSAVRDAFDTMISQGLSDYQKKLRLKRLMNLGTGKRKELSDEWKALCVEETRLSIKKLRFSAKLTEAGYGS